MVPPSGEQIELAYGSVRAVVTEVGATLRSLRRQGAPVLWEFAEGEQSSGGRGQVLAPWPNRLEDGRYEFAGAHAQAALDEPERATAIHGLVRWWPWTIEARSVEQVLLSCVVHPQPAYPFRVRLELDYRLEQEGLRVRCSATNTGTGAAPFGLGFHPYLDAGRAGVDNAVLDLPAAKHLLLDGRGLPCGVEPTAGGAFELRHRELRGLVLDDCYSALELGPGGRWKAGFESAGARCELWADGAFAYVMCYTGDTLEDPADRRRAVAVEPMTCPPNALRTGEGLLVLAPGDRWTAEWGISVL